MKTLCLLFLAATLQMLSAAPKDLLDKERDILKNLHKSWHTVEPPPEYPRKGEYECKGGICKTKVPCKGCQGPVPLDVNWEYI
ncbi:unnamed protein product, partial [Brenthis ino]